MTLGSSSHQGHPHPPPPAKCSQRCGPEPSPAATREIGIRGSSLDHLEVCLDLGSRQQDRHDRQSPTASSMLAAHAELPRTVLGTVHAECSGRAVWARSPLAKLVCVTGRAGRTLLPAGPLRAWDEARGLESLCAPGSCVEKVQERCGVMWTGVGSRDGTKRLQSCRTSRAAGSLSSASLLMLPAPRTTPPRTPPLGPAPWMPDSFASPPTAQHSAQKALLGRHDTHIRTPAAPPPRAPAPRLSGRFSLCPTLKRAQLPFKCPILESPHRNVQMARGF